MVRVGTYFGGGELVGWELEKSVRVGTCFGRGERVGRGLEKCVKVVKPNFWALTYVIYVLLLVENMSL